MVLRAGGGSIQCLQDVMWTIMIKKNKSDTVRTKVFKTKKKRCETRTSEKIRWSLVRSKEHKIWPCAQLQRNGVLFSLSINPSLLNHGHPWGQTGRREQIVLSSTQLCKAAIGKRDTFGWFHGPQTFATNQSGRRMSRDGEELAGGWKMAGDQCGEDKWRKIRVNSIDSN